MHSRLDLFAGDGQQSPVSFSYFWGFFGNKPTQAQVKLLVPGQIKPTASYLSQGRFFFFFSGTV